MQWGLIKFATFYPHEYYKILCIWYDAHDFVCTSLLTLLTADALPCYLLLSPVNQYNKPGARKVIFAC